ncbi:MAG: toprim domain-containing protein, partial [Spirochaetes bacterium]|nr:toprim domain-containing protein [Spirochaetota bacterium]
MMAKKILDDAFFFEDEGDIIDRVAREHEILEQQRKTNNIDNLLRLKISEIEVEKETEINLISIIEHYHKSLFNSTKAIEYLEKLGLKNKENYARFKLGYCDGSLLNKLSKKQLLELKKLNLLKEGGTDSAISSRKGWAEYFYNCIIFPIYNNDIELTDIYGLNLNDNKITHIELKKKNKGIFNIGAIKVYDEIILTNSLIDCLSLIEPGINNVIAVEGTGNLCADHITRLRDNRVKTVVLAFSNDAVNRGGADILTDLFITEGFKVKLIFPPQNAKDWNECLLSGVESKEIKDLIDNAEIFESQEVKKAFQVKKDGFKHIFVIGEVTYTVTGVKEIFISNLRVNIKAEYEGERF